MRFRGQRFEVEGIIRHYDAAANIYTSKLPSTTTVVSNSPTMLYNTITIYLPDQEIFLQYAA
jgi:hypothetical protein